MSHDPATYPQFPLYIPSKGRHEYMITSKALTLMGVRHHVVVEPQQADDYRRAVEKMGLLATVLELDMSYKERYELCDDLGLTKSTGRGLPGTSSGSTPWPRGSPGTGSWTTTSWTSTG